MKSNNSHDKRINIVDVLKPADDVIENYYYERSRKRKLIGYDDEDEVWNLIFLKKWLHQGNC